MLVAVFGRFCPLRPVLFLSASASLYAGQVRTIVVCNIFISYVGRSCKTAVRLLIDSVHHLVDFLCCIIEIR